MKYTNKLLRLINSIESTIEENLGYMSISKHDTDYNIMQNYNSNTEPEFMRRFNRLVLREERKIQEQLNIKLSEIDKEILYLFGSSFYWTRGETKPKEGLLSGGFSFNSIDGMFFYPSSHWEYGLNQFNKFEESSLEEITLIKKLMWFESTSTPQEVLPSQNIGCFLLEKDKFPSKFYFFSNGLCYRLSFDNFISYIDALIASCGVEYWQYFYIDPAIIITKNKGLIYLTHGTHHKTCLNKRLRDLTYHPNTPYDRLDLIHEHLERCVRLLPNTFPFADFTHHQNYYKRFKELYDASKKE